KSTSKRLMPEPADKLPDGATLTSSIPVAIPPKQEGLYREVLSILEDRHVPYAVAGAFALQQHTGICRYTKDLDIFLRSEDVAKALGHLREHGFECEICDPVWLAKAHRDEFFVDLITGMSNAVITVDSSWIELAHPALIVDIPTRVLAPEELLASKLFVTRRERFDGADIAHIIYGTKGRLDWDRVLRHAGEHWEILFWALILFHFVYPAHSDYVPLVLWQDLLARFKNEIKKPDLKAPFRGSLVDEVMFAIDLQEWGLENLLEEYRQRREPKLISFAGKTCG
ncbi:MAG: hypothetical protein AUH01_03825, partial [Acidobacteria bacterium 13_2_20CM_56_17]